MAKLTAAQISLAEVKNRLSEMVDRLERDYGRVVITIVRPSRGGGFSIEKLVSLEETLDVMSSPSLVAEIREALAELGVSAGPVLSKDEARRLIADLVSDGDYPIGVGFAGVARTTGSSTASTKKITESTSSPSYTEPTPTAQPFVVADRTPGVRAVRSGTRVVTCGPAVVASSTPAGRTTPAPDRSMVGPAEPAPGLPQSEEGDKGSERRRSTW